MVLLSTVTHAACPAYGSIQEQKSCNACSVKKPPCRDKLYQNSDFSDNFLAQLQQESLQKVEELQKDPEFQEIVTELKSSTSKFYSVYSALGNVEQSALYIFVSFSMGEKALLNIAHEAKQFEAILVLRGFKQGSYIKTVQSLQNIIIKTGQGVIIDPELYSLFNITAVPTFVLAKPFTLAAVERTQASIKWAPIHDKLQGHVSAHYALEQFTKEGDLKDKAQELLRTGETK